MKNILFMLAIGLAALPSFGQQKKWHELEGYFQFTVNKEQYVQFTSRDSVLVATLLWNNFQLQLLPDTGLSFVSKEAVEGGPVHVGFVRDATGVVNQVRVAAGGIWTRVANYTPHIKHMMVHTPEQLQKFIGLYQLRSDTSLYIRLEVDSNTLTIHRTWDGSVIDNLVPETELNFFKSENPIFTLNFSQDHEGNASQFVLVGRDTWIKVPKAAPSAAQWKTYEGKYRSEDDPDNIVQLIAGDKDLVVRELWNKKEIRLEPLTNTYFNDVLLSFSLKIIMENGRAKKIIVLGNQSFVRID